MQPTILLRFVLYACIAPLLLCSGCQTGCIGNDVVLLTELGGLGAEPQIVSVSAADEAQAVELAREVLTARFQALNVYSETDCEGRNGERVIKSGLDYFNSALLDSNRMPGSGDLAVEGSGITVLQELAVVSEDLPYQQPLSLEGHTSLDLAQQAVDEVNPFTSRGKNSGWSEQNTPQDSQGEFSMRWTLTGQLDGLPIVVVCDQLMRGYRRQP